MSIAKNIGLVAHDAKKAEMLAWTARHVETLYKHNLICTGTTGRLISEMLAKDFPQFSPSITRFKSGPLGGDQQLGARIVEGGLDILIFLTDPMTSQPHDVDVKALVRLCTVYNIVLACTPATADFVIASPLFSTPYTPESCDYTAYTHRQTI